MAIKYIRYLYNDDYPIKIIFRYENIFTINAELYAHDINEIETFAKCYSTYCRCYFFAFFHSARSPPDRLESSKIQIGGKQMYNNNEKLKNLQLIKED